MPSCNPPPPNTSETHFNRNDSVGEFLISLCFWFPPTERSNNSSPRVWGCWRQAAIPTRRRRGTRGGRGRQRMSRDGPPGVRSLYHMAVCWLQAKRRGQGATGNCAIKQDFLQQPDSSKIYKSRLKQMPHPHHITRAKKKFLRCQRHRRKIF